MFFTGVSTLNFCQSNVGVIVWERFRCRKAGLPSSSGMSHIRAQPHVKFPERELTLQNKNQRRR